MINRSEYKVSGMDCSAEEQIIRVALGDNEKICRLEFNLIERTLIVWHTHNADSVTENLAGLHLGAELLQTTELPDSKLPSDSQKDSDRAQAGVLRLLLAINAAMFVLEAVSGWIFASTGLLADSLDMLADAGVYGISLYAVGKAAKFKFRAAHISGWLQLALAAGALFEVARRFVYGSGPDPPYMIGVAAIALTANVICLWLIARYREHGAHMKASWIFSTNDVIANFGVIVAGVLVALTGSRYPDLIVGAIIGIIVMIGAIRILRIR